ncbi:MAG: hypothetical protein V1494_01400 [Candidatus Diapherotrites archaeon]
MGERILWEDRYPLANLVYLIAALVVLALVSAALISTAIFRYNDVSTGKTFYYQGRTITIAPEIEDLQPSTALVFFVLLAVIIICLGCFVYTAMFLGHILLFFEEFKIRVAENSLILGSSLFFPKKIIVPFKGIKEIEFTSLGKLNKTIADLAAVEKFFAPITKLIGTYTGGNESISQLRFLQITTQEKTIMRGILDSKSFIRKIPEIENIKIKISD